MSAVPTYVDAPHWFPAHWHTYLMTGDRNGLTPAAFQAIKTALVRAHLRRAQFVAASEPMEADPDLTDRRGLVRCYTVRTELDPRVAAMGPIPQLRTIWALTSQWGQPKNLGPATRENWERALKKPNWVLRSAPTGETPDFSRASDQAILEQKKKSD